MIAFGANPVLPALPHRDDGLMAIPVTTGHVELAIDWTTTRDAVIGRWLSTLALIALLGLYFFERHFSARGSPHL